MRGGPWSIGDMVLHVFLAGLIATILVGIFDNDKRGGP